jgi:hypothetical protein
VLDLLLSVAAGAVGGLLVVLGQRFLFSAEESWTRAGRSRRFLLHKLQEALGRAKVRCPECLEGDARFHDVVAGPNEDPATGEVYGTYAYAEYSCPHCGHHWNEELDDSAVTFPDPGEDGA